MTTLATLTHRAYHLAVRIARRVLEAEAARLELAHAPFRSTTR